jgi:phosphoglycolate phosphatase-like HAD superfamily hydrolase
MAIMATDPQGNLTMWKPATVVFDADGLLVDTEPGWTVAETELFARRGLGFGPEQKALVIGKSLAAAAELLTGVFGEPGAADAIARELLLLVEEGRPCTTNASWPGSPPGVPDRSTPRSCRPYHGVGWRHDGSVTRARRASKP